MELNLSTCCLLVLLCHSATAQVVDLLPCTVDIDSESARHCVAFDSTADTYHAGSNITAILSIELPMPILDECWLNKKKIAIVTSSGHEISSGKKILSNQDRGTCRWLLELTFQEVNENYGRLNLELHILNVMYRDTQLLHLEIRSEITIFKTGDKQWIYVPSKTANGTESGHEKNVSTEENMSFEDLRANLQERVEVLNEEKLVLQKELTAVLNDLTRSQAERIDCLESKNASAVTMKNQDLIPGLNALGVTSFVLFFATAFTIIGLIVRFFIKYGIKVQPIDETCGTEFSQTEPYDGITLYYYSQRCASPESMKMV